MTKLHSILISSGNASPWIEASLNSLKSVHPGKALAVYSDEALRQFISDSFDKEVLSAYDHGDSESKSYLGRYCLLFAQGGVYSDPTVFFVGPLLDSAGATLQAFHNADSEGPSVSVSLIAAPAKMVLFETCIRKFVELARDHNSDMKFAASRIFAETIAYCGPSSRVALSWGDELRLPSRPGVIRQAYKSAAGAFVAVRQLRKDGWRGAATRDGAHGGYDDPEDVDALLSLDGWI
jgi:hypothetical protein